MNFFPTRNGNDCFCVSLANLLLLQGERELAGSVYNNYEHHPLIHSRLHVAHGLGPRIIRDLTENRYQGMYTGWWSDDWRAITHGLFHDAAVLEAIADELEAGTICRTNRIEKFHKPALMIVQKDSADRHHTAHAFVFAEEEGESFICIDAESRQRVYKNGLDYVGVVEVWPSQS